jgi:hypothetical protein
LARKDVAQNGHDRLEDAMATLIQNQAAFVGSQAEFARRQAESERQHLEFERRHLEFERQSSERFARIEADIAAILRVLAEHSRLLERLPEAVRDKIGFKT